MIVCGQSLRFVALAACDGRMLPGKRVSSPRVKLHVERRGLEVINGVTRRAFDSRGPGRKLAPMFVRMTIDAFGAADRRAEIRRLMTTAACHCGVPACQRVGCPAVIEIREYRRSGDAPACRFMTLLAGACESAIVRIAMAARALSKGKTRETDRRTFFLRRVTSFARHAFVQSREGEVSLCMIKVCDRFPRSRRVAIHALRAKLSAVLVLVARGARGLQPEKTLRCMALSAGERGMLAFEGVPCLLVVELRDVAGPSNETEIAAGMFGVTSRAIATTFA